MLQPQKSTMTWICGIYRIIEGLPYFAILTRKAPENIRFIHDKMPLLMPKELIGEWIQPERKPEEMLGRAVTEMVWEKEVR